MPANHLDSTKVNYRKYRILETPVSCDHPSCGVVVAPGYPVYHARLRSDLYCSPECRGRDTRRLIQNSRRAEVPSQLEYERDQKLRSKYGLSSNDWDMLYDAQLGRCAICLLPLSETKVHVDHDHTTGRVRGLLCKTCNPGLGFFRDDPKVLMRAANYLLDTGEASALSPEHGEGVKDSVD